MDKLDGHYSKDRFLRFASMHTFVNVYMQPIKGTLAAGDKISDCLRCFPIIDVPNQIKINIITGCYSQSFEMCC